MSDVAIGVKNLSKTFKLPIDNYNGVKQLVLNLAKRKKGYEIQNVLTDISFEIKKGDFFGIVGRNGSGKSTLLKLLAEIYTPDSGSVAISGSLIPFIELGVGFNPELTGRENVFLNGALLGFGRQEMEAMYDDIVEFAELERFMDQKLKNYSSGMQVRLAFSIAIRAKSDILLLDEVLAVGDEAFQRKCFSYFAELKLRGQTVILVTHSMDLVQQFCNRAALIDKGHELVVGTPFEIAKIYRELNSDSGITGVLDELSSVQQSDYFSLNANFDNNDGWLDFKLNLKPLKRVDDFLVLTFVIHKDSGEMLYRFTSDEKIDKKIDFNKAQKFNIKVKNIFPDGVFSVEVGVKKIDRSKNYALFNNVIEFELSNGLGREYWRPDEAYAIEEQTHDE